MTISEPAIVHEVAEVLRRDGWDPYFEVVLPREIREEHPQVGDGRADIVATRPHEDSEYPILLVVECKADLSMALLAQAWRWARYANQTAVACTAVKDNPARRMAHYITQRRLGFGIFELADTGLEESALRGMVLP